MRCCRSVALAVLLFATVAHAATSAHSPIQTWGWFGAYDSNGQTTLDWPTKLNMPLIIGGVDVQGPIVDTMHTRAQTAGNLGQAVVFYLGFAGNDNACSCYEETIGDAWIAAHSTWQLKNGSGQYVFTSDAANPTPRVRAMDIGNTAYVNAWADEVIAEAGRHHWDGVLADYVFRCDSQYPFYHWSTSTAGQYTTPRRTATGIDYTCATYRDDMLAAVRILKDRLHAAGLVFMANHGGAYNDTCDGSGDFQDTKLQQELEQFDVAQLEMCIYDGNGNPYSETCWLDQLKYGKYAVDHGVGYFCQGYNGQISNTSKRPYILASTLLVADGQSGVGQLNGASNWDATTYEMKLGDPIPCTWPGLQARRHEDSGDECIDASGNITPCPGVQYRRRRDRTEECVTSSGTVVGRGCEGSNLVRRRHMDQRSECVNSSGIIQAAPIPYECLDSNGNPTTTGCPGTTGYTYRRRFKYGAVIVNPIDAVSRTMYFSEPHGSGTYMDGCVGPGTGGYADTFAGPNGEVCWRTPTPPVTTTTTSGPPTTTTTTLYPPVGLGMVHETWWTCDSNFTSYPHVTKTIVPENPDYLTGTTVNGTNWATMVSQHDTCGQTELPVAINLPAWEDGNTSDLQTIFQNFMQADPNYVGSGGYTPKVPAWEFGLEENLAARGDKCCTTLQTDSSSILYAKLSALQTAKANVNGGSGFMVGYQLAETDSGALTDIQTFLNSPCANKVDFLGLHPYTWGTWPEPDSWFPAYMNSIDSYKAASGHTNLPLWVTEIGVPVVSPITTSYVAQYTAKFTTLAFSRGIQKVLWYHYKDDPSDPSCPSGAECNFGLISSTGTQRYAYTTWLLLNQFLSGKHFVDVTSPASQVNVYRFTDGSQTAMVAWHYPSGTSSVALSSLPVYPTTLTNYLGSTVTPVGGSITVGVGPVFMHD